MRRPSANADAYDCYLRGLACYPLTTAERTDQALDMFTKAGSLDPGFASAHAWAMLCHANRLVFGVKDLARERNEVTRLWQIVARTGRDDGLALATAAWAVAYMLREVSSAKGMIDKAIELNPNLASAWQNGGWISLWQGDCVLAVEQLSRAYRLDPASDGVHLPMAHACFFLERYEEALDQAQQRLRGYPNTHAALRIGAASAAFAGRGDMARDLGRRLLEVDPEFGVSRLGEYLGPYQRSEFAEKYSEGLRLAGLPE